MEEKISNNKMEEEEKEEEKQKTKAKCWQLYWNFS